MSTTPPRVARKPLPLPIELGICLPVGALANLFDPKPTNDQSCLDRGREEVEIAVDKVGNHMTNAKGTGQLAIAFGVPMLQRKLIARIDQARGRPPRPEPVAPEWPQADDAATEAAQETTGGSGTDLRARDREPQPEDFATATTAVAHQAAGATPHALAIPGYDTLSASQVVERLSGLDDAERDAIRQYEAAHRNRRTILGKIDQLRSAG